MSNKTYDPDLAVKNELIRSYDQEQPELTLHPDKEHHHSNAISSDVVIKNKNNNNSSNSNRNKKNGTNNDSKNNSKNINSSGSDGNAQGKTEPRSHSLLAYDSVSSSSTSTTANTTIATTTKTKIQQTTTGCSKQKQQCKPKSTKLQKEKQQQQEKLQQQPPREFLCPITQQLMVYPLRTPYGQNFEGSAIFEWLIMFSPTRSTAVTVTTTPSSQSTCISTTTTSCCPLTRQPLKTTDLIPNLELQEKIAQWRKETANLTEARELNHNNNNNPRKEKAETESEDTNDEDDFCFSLFPVVGKSSPRCPILPPIRAHRLQQQPERPMTSNMSLSSSSTSLSLAAAHRVVSAVLRATPSSEQSAAASPHPVDHPATTTDVVFFTTDGPTPPSATSLSPSTTGSDCPPGSAATKAPHAVTGELSSSRGESTAAYDHNDANDDIETAAGNVTAATAATETITASSIRDSNVFMDGLRSAISSIDEILLEDIDLPQLQLHYYPMTTDSSTISAPCRRPLPLPPPYGLGHAPERVSARTPQEPEIVGNDDSGMSGAGSLGTRYVVPEK